MASYEIAVLYDPDLEVDLEKAESRVKKIITDHGGTVSATDNWGKRRLAYQISKHESAIYVFYSVDLKPESLGRINSELNITGEVIRFLITKPDFKRQAKAEAERIVKAKKNAERASGGQAEDD